MKEYSVSLDIVSANLTLEDLTAQIGAEPSEGSHEIGSPRARRGFWRETVLLPIEDRRLRS